MDARGVSVWTGVLTTAQFSGVVFGNIMIGFAGDRFGEAGGVDC